MDVEKPQRQPSGDDANDGRAEMANHGKQARTGKRRERHYAKPSRAKRHERRWDARVREMEDEIFRRAAEARAAAEAVEKAAA
jgi:hypothetical protein